MKILPLMLIIVAGLLGACSEGPQIDLTGRAAALAKTIAAEQDHVTVAELSDWIIKEQRDFELVDIREATEFEAGHIRDARHVPLAGLMSDASLAALPPGRKVVVYSNGTAHAAQAALLLRLVDRDAYALLGGFNHWQAYLNDPAAAGVAAMDPAERAQYQAVACFFAGDYLAAAGLVPQGGPPVAEPDRSESQAADPLGLGLGLGSEEIRAAVPAGSPGGSPGPSADPLGLGLDLGLGGEAAKSLPQSPPAQSPGGGARLLIKAEC